MTELRLRADLASIPNYVPGKAPAPKPGIEVYKVSSNENPYGPLPSVLKRIVDTAQGVNRYPESASQHLIPALAERHGVPAEEIVLGSGSVETVSQLIRATAGPGDEVVFAWRSFEAYPMLVRAAGATPIEVPLDGEHRHDLDAMVAAVTERTRLILVCNPNNPTGTTIDATALERFLAAVPHDIVVVIDEAYQHFNTREDSPDGVEFFRRHPNVAVAHTFSKAYGLAGLRVGYALAHEPLADSLRKVALPFGVTTPAQHAALASLEAESELQERVDALVAERERVLDTLRGQGWSLPESQGNFVWFPLGEDTAAAAEIFEEQGLMIRPFAGEGFRATIAEQGANDRLIELSAVLVERGLTGGLVGGLVSVHSPE